MTKTIDALFIGALNYDVYINVPNLNRAIDATSLDNAVPLLLPSERRIGGGAAITAVALATLGLSTAVVGAVGKDGDALLEALKQAGVISLITQHSRVPTAVTLAYHTPEGGELYKANTQSNELFGTGDLTKLLGNVRQSRLVMRTGYPWMPQLAGLPTAELFRFARQNDVITALDMSNPKALDKRVLEELVSEVLPNVDLLCANVNELYCLANYKAGPDVGVSELETTISSETILDYSSQLIRRGVNIVNVHCGERGTVLVTNSGYVHAIPPQVAHIVNPTGCGNLQNAGFIYCLLNDGRLDRLGSSLGLGLDLFYAAKFANAAAALRLGGKEFPTFEQIKALV